MFVSNPSQLSSDPQQIDISEALWAAEYLSLMIERLGARSPVGMLLVQARRELASLAQGEPGQGFVNPFRFAG